MEKKPTYCPHCGCNGNCGLERLVDALGGENLGTNIIFGHELKKVIDSVKMKD